MRIVRPRVSLAGILLAALAAVIVTGLGSPAMAHSALTGSTPGEGDQVATAPEAVVLTFNEDVTELGTEVIVSGPMGDVLSAGKAEVAGPTVTQPLVSARPAGAYTVTWRAVSADGHPITGEFTFTSSEDVGGAPPSGEGGDEADDQAGDDQEETTPAITVGHDTTESPVLRWAIVLVGAAAVVGLVATVLARRRRDLGE